MKKQLLFMTALSLLAGAVSLTGCSKKVNPGDVQGYDEGEQYISMWVHTIEDTPEGEAYKQSLKASMKSMTVHILLTLNLFRETTAEEDILTR